MEIACTSTVRSFAASTVSAQSHQDRTRSRWSGRASAPNRARRVSVVACAVGPAAGQPPPRPRAVPQDRAARPGPWPDPSRPHPARRARSGAAPRRTASPAPSAGPASLDRGKPPPPRAAAAGRGRLQRVQDLRLMTDPQRGRACQANFSTNRPSTTALALQYCGSSLGSSPRGTIGASARSGATVRSAARSASTVGSPSQLSSTPAVCPSARLWPVSGRALGLRDGGGSSTTGLLRSAS